MKEEFPWPTVKILAEADIFGIYIPEEFGGMGGGVFDLAIATEELSWGCGGISLAFAATALGTFPIILFGNDEQKKKYLPRIAKGTVASFALTEAEAGSDAGSIKTTARKEGDHYILNGTKQWITNAGDAEIYTVVAITNKAKGARGASAFIVEKGTKGMDFGKKEKKLGIRGSSTREVIFTDCKIPKENLLSREGMGFIVAMKTLDMTRPGIGAQALGIAQGAFDRALAYCKERIQFGKKLAQFQVTQHKLADMAAKIELASLIVYKSAWNFDQGKIDPKLTSIAKMYAARTAVEVADEAIQLLGGYGYMLEYEVERFYRDAKISEIYEGTKEIQKNTIASSLLGKF